MVTSTGFEPVNAAVKGRCVKPLHQLAIQMVDLDGLEPSTSRLSGVHSNQLSYRSRTSYLHNAISFYTIKKKNASNF